MSVSAARAAVGIGTSGRPNVDGAFVAAIDGGVAVEPADAGVARDAVDDDVHAAATTSVKAAMTARGPTLLSPQPSPTPTII